VFGTITFIVTDGTVTHGVLAAWFDVKTPTVSRPLTLDVDGTD
jgi:hypothetical protein